MASKPVTLPLAASHLYARLGVRASELDRADRLRVRMALDDATAIALSEVPEAARRSWEWNLPGAVLTVILKAARREYENPEGYRSQGVGEVNGSVSVASGVFLTDVEKATVRRAAGLAPSGFVGSVRTPSPMEPPAPSRRRRWDW